MFTDKVVSNTFPKTAPFRKVAHSRKMSDFRGRYINHLPWLQLAVASSPWHNVKSDMLKSPAQRDLCMRGKKLKLLKLLKNMKYRVIKYPPSEFARSIINEKNISRE